MAAASARGLVVSHSVENTGKQEERPVMDQIHPRLPPQLSSGALARRAPPPAGLPTVLRAQAREIKVGHVHPLSGPLAFDGGLVVNGMTLAVEEINAAGGIKSAGRR